MRRAPRKDSNHAQIAEAFRRHGVAVLDLAGLSGLGFDLLCLYGDRCRLVEVKDGCKKPSARRLTDAEAKMALLYGDVWRVVSDEYEAMDVVWELKPSVRPRDPDSTIRAAHTHVNLAGTIRRVKR